YDELVSPLFALMKGNEEENRRLSELRDTLLPKLMSGELDVSNIEL
ncbi:MAG: restriction endonuclease subunit S, partial [Ruminococcaceae bacterium]|nr:restriction endonuclease subunit S [Oscillospiraceae bacterium]